MSEGEPQHNNPETEKQLEVLTIEKLSEMLKNNDYERVDRLEEVLRQFDEIGSLARLALGSLEHSYSKGRDEDTYAFGLIEDIQDVVKKYCPEGKLMF